MHDGITEEPAPPSLARRRAGDDLFACPPVQWRRARTRDDEEVLCPRGRKIIFAIIQLKYENYIFVSCQKGA
jgi:hypothetical protein